MPSSPRALLITAVICWMLCVVLGLAAGAPLTSDESAYALLASGRGHEWMYRPVGLVALARVGVALGGTDIAMRLPCALVSPLLLLAVAAIGRRLGPWTGVGAAAVIAGTHTFVLRAPELLTDIPSTTCVLAAMLVLIDELGRPDGPRYRLVLVAPLLAAAFYLRYGVAPVIAIVAISAIVVWPRALWTRPGPAVATALVFAALLVPFLVYSQRTTGSVVGILAIADEVAGRRFLGHGLWIYVASNPFVFYGVPITPVMITGLIGLLRPPRARRRTALFLGLVALGQLIVLGLIAHASTRYVFLAMALLAVLGVELLLRAVRSPGARCGLAIAAVLGCAAMVTVMVPLERLMTRNLAPLLAATREIRRDAAGQPCSVICRATPQVMWYSGCNAEKIAGASDALVLPPGRRWYAMSTPHRPIDGDALARRSNADAIALPAPGAWRLQPHGQ